MAPPKTQGGCGSRQQGRGNDGRGDRTTSKKTTTPAQSTKFQGTITELKGHIFDCTDYKQADRYTTTLRHLCEYVGSKMKNGGDVRASIAVGKAIDIPDPPTPTIVDPTKPTAKEKIELAKFDRKINGIADREEKLVQNIKSLFSIVEQQCTNMMKAKLEQSLNWQTILDAQDGIELLKMIKTIVHKFEDQKFTPLAVTNAKLNLYQFRQGNLTCSEYLRKFTNLADISLSYDGTLHDPAIAHFVFNDQFKEDPTTGQPRASFVTITDAAELKRFHERCEEMVRATLFLQFADKRRFGKLIEDLENNFTRGSDEYPRDLVTAYKMINEFKHWTPRQTVSDSQSTVFSQKSETKDDWKKSATCHNCGKIGQLQT